VWADKHGVRSNAFRRPNFKSFPHFFHRLKTAKPTATTASFVTWKPIAEHIEQSVDVSVVTSIENKTNANEYARIEREQAAKAGTFLRDEDADAVFVVDRVKTGRRGSG